MERREKLKTRAAHPNQTAGSRLGGARAASAILGADLGPDLEGRVRPQDRDRVA